MHMDISFPHVFGQKKKLLTYCHYHLVSERLNFVSPTNFFVFRPVLTPIATKNGTAEYLVKIEKQYEFHLHGSAYSLDELFSS